MRGATFHRLRNRAATVGLGLALAAAPVSAVLETPSDLRDLVHGGLDEGQRVMARRGYEQIHSSSSGGQYWWNGRRRTCVFLMPEGNEIGALKSVERQDCRQYFQGSSQGSSQGWSWLDQPDQAGSFELSDLAGQKLADGQRQLSKRGYRLVHSSAQGGGSQYWWNAERKRCVFLDVDGKEIEGAKSVDKDICKKYLKGD
jgi:hypothetical protein